MLWNARWSLEGLFMRPELKEAVADSGVDAAGNMSWYSRAL